MAIESLRAWVDQLAQTQELVRIDQPVKAHLEISALANVEMKAPRGGRAILVERPLLADGSVSKFPVLVNGFGSHERMRSVLKGRSPDEVADQIAFLLKAKPPRSLREAWDLLSRGIGVIHARPKRVGRGACQENVWRREDGGAGLGALPVLTCWPEDGGPFITLPNVYTQDPDTGERNVGMYRMQVFDGWTTGMHWQMHKVGARHGKRYVETGQKMPVSVALGGDPVFTFAATAPLPDGLDEILLAGYLRGAAVPMVKCLTNDLLVPADSDFVIEGYVDPRAELREEGPFGDHTGFYTPVDRYPEFHVTAITYRDGAIYPATVVGPPPMEDFYLGTASVRIFLPVLKMNFPELVDLALPAEGVFHNLVFVSIKKQYPYQAFKVMNGLWGMGQMMFSKIIVVVDHDVDVHNTHEVLFRLCANIDPQRDMLFTRAPCDSLDHGPSEPNIGSHVGIDATRKLPGEGYHRPWPKMCSLPNELLDWAREVLHR